MKQFLKTLHTNFLALSPLDLTVVLLNVFLIAVAIFEGKAEALVLVPFWIGIISIPLYWTPRAKKIIAETEKQIEANQRKAADFCNAAVDLAIRAHLLREWHRSEYQSNRRLDADFDNALKAFAAQAGLEFPAASSVVVPDPNSQTPAQKSGDQSQNA